MQETLLPLKSTTKAKKDHRRVTPTLCSSTNIHNSCLLEKLLLPNGDLYTGTSSSSSSLRVPHGRGKYIWSDGCIYQGEWLKGKPNGLGKFSWPSGSTYEGHFKSGRMEGTGTFIGVNNSGSYKGSWLNDRKHGYGVKRYGNGDVYEGFWKDNVQDGEGKYVWSNGNCEYVGGWRNGVISGKGVLTTMPVEGNRGLEMRKRCSVDGGGGGGGGRVIRDFPTICIWEMDGEAGDITCDIVASVDSSVFYKNEMKFDGGGGVGHVQRSPRVSEDNGEVKKPGQTISKGHKNYDLTLNLQLGMRHSVCKHTSKLRELRQSDFDPKEKYWTRFPPEGSKSTPRHQSVDFKWKDYYPVVFRHLRELFGIDPANYMLAICGSDTLREFSSPGKSGSFFYLTQDDRFMIKTVKKSEVKVLTRMLSTYYRHVCQYKNSLLTKFLGVHCVKPLGGQKTRFVVMGNLFCSEYRIHKRFDLKGSSYGRSTDKPEEEINETTILKDLDLNFVFHLERSWFQELFRQIDRDCEFLEAERIMDYSLLVGVHFCDDFLRDEMASSDKGNMREDETSMRGYHLLPEMDWIMEGRGALIRLGANMPGKAQRVSRIESDQSTRGGSCNSTFSKSGSGEMFDVVLYFGIIDILQDYDISKKLEHAYKSLQVDSTSISAVDPKLYSKRFRDFIRKIFVELAMVTEKSGGLMVKAERSL
ncbi:hypothetical protein ACFE04_012407 [Oxalis oulophora]